MTAVGVGRVLHGYSEGQRLTHRTPTHTHRNPCMVTTVTPRKHCGILLNPQCHAYEQLATCFMYMPLPLLVRLSLPFAMYLSMLGVALSLAR